MKSFTLIIHEEGYFKLREGSSEDVEGAEDSTVTGSLCTISR